WTTLAGSEAIVGDVRCLSTDDVAGHALYAGGAFSTAGISCASNVARWNGTQWSALGSGTDGTVDALHTFDDGTGGELYAAGEFTHAGGSLASCVAAWDGSSWSAVGRGITGAATRAVRALAT